MRQTVTFTRSPRHCASPSTSPSPLTSFILANVPLGLWTVCSNVLELASIATLTDHLDIHTFYSNVMLAKDVSKGPKRYGGP